MYNNMHNKIAFGKKIPNSLTALYPSKTLSEPPRYARSILRNTGMNSIFMVSNSEKNYFK